MPKTKKARKRRVPDANVNAKKYVPSTGPKNAKIVFVGEAPGANEEKEKKPFVGYSGQFFQEKLLQAGLSYDEVFITNVCHYRPPYNNIKKWIGSFGNKNNCAPPVVAGIIELYTELAEIVDNGGANVIVPLGNVALWALTGKMGITKYRSSILAVEPVVDIFAQIKENFPDLLPVAAEAFNTLQGRKVIPTLHPASVTRQITMSPILLFDLHRIVEESSHPNIFLPERTHYIDTTEGEATELARRLLEFDSIGCDIESVGYRVYSVQFSGDPSWSLVLKDDEPWKRQLIRHICESENEKIFQFGWFDTWYLLIKNNIVVRNYRHDLAIAARCAYPDWPVGLDFQTAMQTREPYYKDERKVWDKVDPEGEEVFLTYGGKDACVTKEIAAVQKRDELTEPGTRVAFEHKMKLVPLAVEMATRGIKIDRAKMIELQHKFTEQSNTLQELIDTQVIKDIQHVAKQSPKLKPYCQTLLGKMLDNRKKGKPAFNVNSTGEGNQMDLYLYGIKDLKPVHKGRGRGKKRTTDEEALKELYGDTGDEVLLTIVQKRKTDKLLGTELSMKIDGANRTYFSVNPAGTKTLRWTFTQNIEGYGCNGQAWHPKAKEMAIPDDGYIFGNFDLAQVEDRIVAYLAGVQKKIHAFENGIDAHALTATGIFGGTIEEIVAEDKEYKKNGKQSPRRYLGKQSNHAYNYGEGPVRFWKRVNKKRDETGISITRKQSFQAKEAHGRLYPEVAWYQKDIDARLYRDRKLTNIFGWERTFRAPITDEAKRDAYSWIPQSSAPWIIDLGMLAIREKLPQVHILMHGHDSVFCQMPEAEAEDLFEEIIRLMTIPIMINGHEITIPVDGELSHTM